MHFIVKKTMQMLMPSLLCFTLLASCAPQPKSKEVTKQTIQQIQDKETPADWVYLEPTPHAVRFKMRSVDSLIRSQKEDYFNQCVYWLQKNDIPRSDCEYKLLDKIEARYGITDDPEKIMRVVDELFFEQVNPSILKLLQRRPDLIKQAQSQFRSEAELLQYYREQYSFQKPITDLETRKEVPTIPRSSE
jgi:hypothetical protein